ncbi:MAG: SusC/RagA family TonB-linked outer membrane protein, partial [Bacteroidales bacterium]|nr:SusC/RagA family TonB-linked outer membrane protein [Bacteroidales bacterium]
GRFTGNSGELKFWGHEIELISHNLVGKFKWTTDVNITFGDNKVVSLAPNVDFILNGNGGIGNSHITKVGGRIGLFYGLVRDGVYINQEDFDNSPHAADAGVGTAKFVDINLDGVITPDPVTGDCTILGDPTPKYLFGFANTFNYEDFDLSVVCSGSVGNDIWNQFEEGTCDMDGAFNVYKEIKDRWRSPENPGSGKYGTTLYGTYMERDWPNSRYISKGTYLTIKNVTLGYNLDVNKIRFISGFRLYISVQQLYTFSRYKGNNPEVSRSGNVLTLGDDLSTYPLPRIYSLGINLRF